MRLLLFDPFISYGFRLHLLGFLLLTVQTDLNYHRPSAEGDFSNFHTNKFNSLLHKKNRVQISNARF